MQLTDMPADDLLKGYDASLLACGRDEVAVKILRREILRRMMLNDKPADRGVSPSAWLRLHYPASAKLPKSRRWCVFALEQADKLINAGHSYQEVLAIGRWTRKRTLHPLIEQFYLDRTTTPAAAPPPV